MGDFRITIEGVGNHGCARRAHETRCKEPSCVDCIAIELVKRLGVQAKSATLEHWPVPGAAGTQRHNNPGPIDNLITGERYGSFTPEVGQPHIPTRAL